MKVLIRYGAELNFSKPTMEEGALCSTVLYICLIYKHYECFKLLLCSGADPDFHIRKKLNLTNLAKDESLLQAVVKHDLPVEFAQLLIEFGINRFQRNSIGRTADQDSGNESAKFIQLSLACPLLLQSQYRIGFRRFLGLHRLQQIPALPLPTKLINFLLFSV
ncbi:ankyrin repeat and SOCS box protein 1-like [Branchiostoma lanceolatum]|uniref:ankyrin repeat and SOCS box protein 1-like n=1 Tax=Branchiostoma lanceolatum TaxID=7740 RepID=UPI00345578DC